MKKLQKTLLFVLALTLVALALFACQPTDNTDDAKTKYTVTFDLDGGVGDDITSQQVEEGAKLNLDKFVPTKDGYTFEGWTVNDEVVAEITVTADVTVKATWKKAVTMYTVTFDLDGGVGEGITSQQVEENTKLSLAQFVPTKDGYTFEGWTVNDEVVAEITVTANVTVKATWKAIYQVEENSDGTYALVGINVPVSGDTLVLPETYLGKKVTVVKATALANAADVKNLVIGNSYVSVEAGAFAPLAKLESVTVPFYGTSVDCNDFVALFQTGEQATDGYFAVTESNVTYLVPDTFDTLTVTGGTFVPKTAKLHIKNLIVASTQITEVANGTIYYDDYIETVDLSGCTEITAIGDSNFSDCDNLRSVSLAGLSKLKYMGAHSFYFYVPSSNETHAMDKIDLSGLTSLTTVGQMSFWYLDIALLDFSETSIVAFGRQNVFYCDVETIKLPQTLNLDISDADSAALEEKYGMTYLNNSEFLGNCSGIADIVVSNLSLYLATENGALYDIDKTVLYKYAQSNSAESYTAPSSLAVIKPTAFSGATNLKTIDLSACTLQNIGYNAFGGCSAALTVGFDSNGYYSADGSKVTLANGWQGGCKVTYGERYLFFTVTPSGLSDNMTVCDETLTFDVVATYGDDNADVEVTFGGEVVAKGADGYTITLAKGANVVTIVATFGDKRSEAKTYTVTYDDEWTLRTSLNDNGVVWVNGNLTFTVWATDAKGNKKNIKDAISVQIDCGYTVGVFVKPGNGLKIEYSEDNTIATVTLDSDGLMMWDFSITDKHHIKVVATQSDSVSVEKIYEAQYFESAPIMESETPTSVSVAAGEKTEITVKCKLGNNYCKIASAKVEYTTGTKYFTYDGFTVEVAEDGLSCTAKLDVDKFVNWCLEDSFKVKITIVTEEGFEANMVFNVTYEW